MAYFEQLADGRFRATEHTGGAWREEEQHIAPALGLLVHLVEQERDARRGPGMVVSRLAYDILGTVPVAEVETSVRTLRPGRTVELVEATMAHAGRDVVVLRAWLLEPRDTAAIAGSPLPEIPGPDELAPWTPSETWPGGFIDSVELRRHRVEPGRGCFWARAHQPLLDGPVSDLARLVGLFDLANGMLVRADPAQVHFPNVDLVAHLVREPAGEWMGFDTSVWFGPGGVGLTSSVLRDTDGPVGTLAQSLTVRPR
ncbi:thioesterase family protein [Phycicoccus sp. CSK15P-2]|uniref:thioesterase family protein n=1 Tax=Phycicoccus sp. CSK15P-2 TaxID=2807627 RepID=UPI0019506CA3|nr:thioesterase family protein [Phycicoccus sp. CSK15P-2]MBM6404097.1 thioesterase family protein [Phycicoccus sp. CSK15P-2]